MEWDQPTYPLVDFPDRGVGRDNLLDALANYFSGWTSYRGEATEFIDAGENVVSVAHEKARIRDSGAIVERDLFHVWTLRDGVCVKWQTFQTRKQALEAAGLSDRAPRPAKKPPLWTRSGYPLCMESGTFPIPATQVDSTLVMTTANTFT